MSIEQKNKKGYYYMSQSLSKILKNTGEQQKEVMFDMLQWYMNEYKKAKKELGTVYALISYHLAIQKIILDNINTSRKPVTCSKGCSFCCSMHVGITKDEAKLLAVYAKGNNIKIDKDKLIRQSKHNEETWLKQPDLDSQCVFLSKAGECSVYQHRPASCRAFHVISSPELCRLSMDKDIYDTEQMAIAEVEIMISAALNVSESGTLSTLLLEQL